MIYCTQQCLTRAPFVLRGRAMSRLVASASANASYSLTTIACSGGCTFAVDLGGQTIPGLATRIGGRRD